MTVLDASGAVELLLNTASGRRLAARLAGDAEVVHVPHLIDVEIAQVLRLYVLRAAGDARQKIGRDGASSLAARHFDVERYPHEPLLDRVWQLRDNVTAYDAVYVALAEALSTVLVTGDRRLARMPGLAVAIEPV